MKILEHTKVKRMVAVPIPIPISRNNAYPQATIVLICINIQDNKCRLTFSEEIRLSMHLLDYREATKFLFL